MRTGTRRKMLCFLGREGLPAALLWSILASWLVCSPRNARVCLGTFSASLAPSTLSNIAHVPSARHCEHAVGEDHHQAPRDCTSREAGTCQRRPAVVDKAPAGGYLGKIPTGQGVAHCADRLGAGGTEEECPAVLPHYHTGQHLRHERVSCLGGLFWLHVRVFGLFEYCRPSTAGRNA